MNSTDRLTLVIIAIMATPALASILCCLGWLGLGFIGLAMEGTK